VHERLEKINQAYYAKVEREGTYLSLEEIEAMDGGGVEAAAEIPEKSRVFSGFGQGTAPESELRANGAELMNLEKPTVFSGSVVDGGLPGVKFPEKTAVLSGSAGVTMGQPAWRGGAPTMAAPLASDWLMRNAPPSSERLRVA